MEHVENKIQDAVENAKSTLKVPPGIIMISNVNNSNIVIEEIKRGDKLWLYVSYVGLDKKRQVFHCSEKDKFRCLFFLGCINSRILITEKLMKITFFYCESCQISIRKESVGPIEFIKSKNINVDVRVNLPVIQIDMSENIGFYQRSDEVVYAIHSCKDIFGVLLNPGVNDKIEKIPMQSSIFGEQTFIMFSKKGIYQIQERYILNGITQHLIIKNTDEKTEDYSGLGFSP